MSETPEDRPRPTPRPRPGAAGARPTSRPRVAGSRRDRDADAPAPRHHGRRPHRHDVAGRRVGRLRRRAAGGDRRRDPPPAGAAPAARRSRPPRPWPPRPAASGAAAARPRPGGAVRAGRRRRWAAAAPAAGPPSVRALVFTAARTGVQDLYAYSTTRTPGKSIHRKLAVLTGAAARPVPGAAVAGRHRRHLPAGLRDDQLRRRGRLGLVQVNDFQDAASVVVLLLVQRPRRNGYSGTQAAPQGSECTVTSDAGRSPARIPSSCTQAKVDGRWKIDDLSLKTTSSRNGPPYSPPPPPPGAAPMRTPWAWRCRRKRPHWHHGRARPGSPARRRPHAADVSLVMAQPPGVDRAR